MTIFKRTIRIVLIVIAIIALAIISPNLYFRISYADFFNKTEQVVKAPFDENFVPYGLTDYNEGFLTVGKNSDNKTAVRFFSEKTSYTVNLLTSDGKKNEKNCTGITTNDKYLYVADNEKRIDVYDLADFDGTKKSSVCIGYFETPITPTVLTVNNDYFYVATNYETNPVNDNSNTKKSKYGSCIISYRLDISQTKTFGIKRTPNSLYSVPDGVKGICFTKDRLVLSIYTDGTSEIRAYNNQSLDYSRITIEDDALDIDVTINHYVIDDDILTNRVKTLPLTYDVAYSNRKVVIVNDYASTKNFFGKFIFGLNYFYGYAI